MVLLQGSKLESKNTEEEAGITNKIILLVQAILTYPTLKVACILLMIYSIMSLTFIHQAST